MKTEYFSDVDDEGGLQKGVLAVLRSDLLDHHRGKRVHITVDRAHVKRSLAQNRLLHMYAALLSKSFGMEGKVGAEQMKEILKYKFLLVEVELGQTGETEKMVLPTSGLSKPDFAVLVDQIIKWASEMGVRLPLPEEYGYDLK